MSPTPAVEPGDLVLYSSGVYPDNAPPSSTGLVSGWVIRQATSEESAGFLAIMEATFDGNVIDEAEGPYLFVSPPDLESVTRNPSSQVPVPVAAVASVVKAIADRAFIADFRP